MSAAGQGAIQPTPQPTAAGEGAAPNYHARDAIEDLSRMNAGTFEQVRDILARVRPPIPWLADPTSVEYRQVFIGLDPQVQPAIPGMPVHIPFWFTRNSAVAYLSRLEGGRRRRKTRKPKRKHFRKRTSRKH